MIVDANVVIAALVGNSLPVLDAARAGGVDLLLPAHQMHEVRRVLYHKFGLDGEQIDASVRRLESIILLIGRETYDMAEGKARKRLTKAGQRDWPVLAAAITLEQPILSNDRDFFGVGVAVWSMPIFRNELEQFDA